MLQIAMSIAMAAQFALVRDVGRQNVGSCPLADTMGPPMQEIVLLEGNDWMEYPANSHPRWPSKKRAKGYWAMYAHLTPQVRGVGIENLGLRLSDFLDEGSVGRRDLAVAELSWFRTLRDLGLEVLVGGVTWRLD